MLGTKLHVPLNNLVIVLFLSRVVEQSAGIPVNKRGRPGNP